MTSYIYIIYVYCPSAWFFFLLFFFVIHPICVAAKAPNESITHTYKHDTNSYTCIVQHYNCNCNPQKEIDGIENVKQSKKFIAAYTQK